MQKELQQNQQEMGSLQLEMQKLEAKLDGKLDQKFEEMKKWLGEMLQAKTGEDAGACQASAVVESVNKLKSPVVESTGDPKKNEVEKEAEMKMGFPLTLQEGDDSDGDNSSDSYESEDEQPAAKKVRFS